MNRQLIQEVTEAVSNINEQLYGQLGPDTSKLLYVIIEPHVGIVSVELGEYQIWHSQDDDREWIEEVSEYNADNVQVYHVPAHYESLEPYLRKKIMKMVGILQTIQL